MKPTFFAGLLAMLISPVLFASSLPEGAIQEGSLSNQQLIQDAMVGVAAKVATEGCSAPESFIPYVMAMPEGNIGARYWRELWVVEGCGKHYPININFSENGLDAAIWSIE